MCTMYVHDAHVRMWCKLEFDYIISSVPTSIKTIHMIIFNRLQAINCYMRKAVSQMKIRSSQHHSNIGLIFFFFSFLVPPDAINSYWLGLKFMIECHEQQRYTVVWLLNMCFILMYTVFICAVQLHSIPMIY